MKLPRVYYKELSQTENISIKSISKINHLKNALRLSKGSQVELFDGIGNSSVYEIISLETKEIVIKCVGSIKIQKPESTKIRLLMPYLKKENLFFAIQKVTEIGINEISLFKPDNIDQSLRKKNLSKIDQKVSLTITQACEQNGSNVIPKFNTYDEISSALTKDTFTILFDLDATQDFKCIKTNSNNITLVTGPESGFSKKEKELLNKLGNYNISLGKNTLRAETAPITALSIIKSNLGLL